MVYTISKSFDICVVSPLSFDIDHYRKSETRSLLNSIPGCVGFWRIEVSQIITLAWVEQDEVTPKFWQINSARVCALSAGNGKIEVQTLLVFLPPSI